jgi:hypothetical protein
MSMLLVVAVLLLEFLRLILVYLLQNQNLMGLEWLNPTSQVSINLVIQELLLERLVRILVPLGCLGRPRMDRHPMKNTSFLQKLLSLGRTLKN